MRGQRDNGVPAPRLNSAEAPRQQIPWPQFWPRRKEMPQQQVLTGFAPIEEVKRINLVIVCPNQRAVFVQYNLYAMDMD